MRRDHFTVSVRQTDTGSPTLAISYDGPRETLTEQLTDSTGELHSADDIDAAYRLQDEIDADEAEGVLSLTHRITGEYLLEANAPASEILSLIRTAKDDGEDEDASEISYCIRIEREDDASIRYEMDALFVYDTEGELLRNHSLIPSGVEL